MTVVGVRKGPITGRIGHLRMAVERNKEYFGV